MVPADVVIETDWASTKQAAPFMPMCTDIVSIGRLRWFEGTTLSGKQNFAWYRFDARHSAGPIFHAHGSAPVLSRVSLCASAARCIGRSDLTPGSARTPVGNALIADD